MRTCLYMFVHIEGGASVKDALQEMVDLANRLQVNLEAEANDVSLIVCPGDQVETLQTCWDMVKMGGRGNLVSCEMARRMMS